MHILEPNPTPFRHAALLTAIAKKCSMIPTLTTINALAIEPVYGPISNIWGDPEALRPHTYYTLFGLLTAFGLRISEALHLLLEEVTADGLVVRNTKLRKGRLVPLHETTAAALQRYLAQRKAGGGGDDHVFISTTGGVLTYAMVNGTSHSLIACVTLGARPGRHPPRLHDLRHYFTIRALENCNGRRKAVAHHMVALSTYLGHAQVTGTHWYLQAMHPA